MPSLPSGGDAQSNFWWTSWRCPSASATYSVLPHSAPAESGVISGFSQEKFMQSPPLLNLVVIRSVDLDRAEKFYNALGLLFERHSHGIGPEHLAWDAMARA